MGLRRVRLVPVLAALLATACHEARGAPARSGFQAARVRLVTVVPRPVAETTGYLASLRSRRHVELRPQVAGQVLRILVRSGDTVQAGAPLVQLDPSRQQAVLASARAMASLTESQLHGAQATLDSLLAARLARVASVDLAQRDLARVLSLFASGAESAQVADRARADAANAQSALGTLDAQIAAQRAAVAAAAHAIRQSRATSREQGVTLEYLRVEAPFAGLVGDIPVHVGDYVTPATVITTMDQAGPLELYVGVPVEQAPRLRLGLAAEITDDAGASLATGTVGFVSPDVDPATQSVLAKVVVAAGTPLRAGQFVRARITWSTRAGLLVPLTAVTRVGSQAFVFVAEPRGRGLVARQRPVDLGPIEADGYVARAGVQAGDRVVAAGAERLTEGAAIAPEP